jgi:MFS family permease
MERKRAVRVFMYSNGRFFVWASIWMQLSETSRLASSFLGSPISAALLQTDGWLGFRGWQWLFILEGLPAVILGLVTLLVLPNRPADARWLTMEQREWLRSRLQMEQTRNQTVGHLSLLQVLGNKYVLAAALVYAGASGASQCLSLWQPQIIKSFGLTDMQTGILNALPFGIASVLTVLWAQSSDKIGERVWHTAIPLALIAGSIVLGLSTNALMPTMIILCLAVVGTYAFKGPFWALSTEWLWCRGCRHRADQRHRKHRWLCRDISPGHHQGRDRELPDGTSAACGIVCGRMRRRSPSWARPVANFRGFGRGSLRATRFRDAPAPGWHRPSANFR